MALWRAARLGTGGTSPLNVGFLPRGWVHSGAQEDEIILV